MTDTDRAIAEIRAALDDPALTDEGAASADTWWACYRVKLACTIPNVRALLAEVERLRAAVTALVPIVEKERARLAINQQKAPERMASSYDGLIAALDAALRLAGINMRWKE